MSEDMSVCQCVHSGDDSKKVFFYQPPTIRSTIRYYPETCRPVPDHRPHTAHDPEPRWLRLPEAPGRE